MAKERKTALSISFNLHMDTSRISTPVAYLSKKIDFEAFLLSGSAFACKAQKET